MYTVYVSASNRIVTHLTDHSDEKNYASPSALSELRFAVNFAASLAFGPPFWTSVTGRHRWRSEDATRRRHRRWRSQRVAFRYLPPTSKAGGELQYLPERSCCIIRARHKSIRGGSRSPLQFSDCPQDRSLIRRLEGRPKNFYGEPWRAVNFFSTRRHRITKTT